MVRETAPATDTSVDGAEVSKHRSEVLLLAGLAAWCAAFAPYFPLLWRTGQFYVGPVALLLILASMWQARDRAPSILRQAASVVLLLIALGALYCSCLQTVTMTHRIFPPSLGAEELTSKDFTLTVATWLLSAILWVLWLRIWTNWPKPRCYLWGVVIFAAHSVIIVGFWLILQSNTPRNVCPAFIVPVLALAAKGSPKHTQIFRLS